MALGLEVWVFSSCVMLAQVYLHLRNLCTSSMDHKAAVVAVVIAPYVKSRVTYTQVKADSTTAVSRLVQAAGLLREKTDGRRATLNSPLPIKIIKS